MMEAEHRICARILSCSGGLYTLHAEARDEYPLPQELSGKLIQVRARGVFRYKGETPVAGDFAVLRYTENSEGLPEDDRGMLMEKLLPRRSMLIRPPLSNLDLLFITAAAASPAPSLLSIDKLCAAASARDVTPVIIINKSELDPDGAERIAAIYRSAGYPAFCVSAKEKTGEEELRRALFLMLPGKCAAFAGASGVGKSSCMNMIFPGIALRTSEISARTGRGRHTTRTAELIRFPVGDSYCFVADTPGFGLLDFSRFDFMEPENLVFAFPEFAPYITKCRYTKCTHVREEGCAILAARDRGELSPSRLESYAEMREELKHRKYK